jgi:hypothetical protein
MAPCRQTVCRRYAHAYGYQDASSAKSTSRNLEECIDTSVSASERIGRLFHRYLKRSGSNENFQYMEEGHFDGGHFDGGHLEEGHLE